MIIKMLVEAGNMKPSPAVSQKIGPLGINMGKLISEINQATALYKGLKVPVEIDINVSTKEFTVKVLKPSVAELLKKELKVEKGSMMPKSIYVGNISIEQVINIAKTKIEELKANSLKAAVKTVLGTCLSSGILVESKNPKEVLEELENGVYDDLIISAEKGKELKPSQEKLNKLQEDFAKVAASQEKLIKELEKAKEEKKAGAGEKTEEAKEKEKSEEK